MNRDHPTGSNDPASEQGVDHSPAFTGVAGGRPGPGVERNTEYTEEIVNRTEPAGTPRRYEQPLEDDEDPVMPSDDATLNTKI